MVNNDNPIVVETTKEFRVPVEQLYEAWNSEEKLKEWWHPFNKNLSRVVNDLKPGGTVEYEFDGDKKFHISGEYQEVVENKRLVYSWSWDLEHNEMKNGDYTLTIDFIPGEGKSRLNVKQEGFIDEKSTDIHKQGWDRGLEALRSYLEENSTGNEPKTESPKSQGQTMKSEEQPGSKEKAQSTKNTKVQPKAKNEGNNKEKNKDQAKEKSEGQPEVKTTAKTEAKTSKQPVVESQEQPEEKTSGKPEAKTSEQPAAESQGQSETKAEGQPQQAKAEGQPAPKDEGASTGKGPKPIGPNQQTWDNPKPGEELKKEIDDQLAKLKKLGENPSDHDPKMDELNKKHDIESRNEGPEHEKKSEKNTQDDFDPAKHKTEAPAH
ncbi:SRPBCC family protein [Flavitalea sp.]|nr:SRPBCC domain-containing protein [Flavitalea sp.]